MKVLKKELDKADAELDVSKKSIAELISQKGSLEIDNKVSSRTSKFVQVLHSAKMITVISSNPGTSREVDAIPTRDLHDWRT